MVIVEVPQHLLLPTMERSIVIVTENISMGISTDPVAMPTSVALHDPTTSANTYHTKIVEVLNTGVSRSIVVPVNMERTEIDRRSVDTVMMRTVVMSVATTDGMKSIVLATVIVKTDVRTDVRADVRTDVRTDVMIDVMIDVMSAGTTVAMIVTAKIVSVSANELRTHTHRTSAELKLFVG